jgi:hypothetical protein
VARCPCAMTVGFRKKRPVEIAAAPSPAECLAKRKRSQPHSSVHTITTQRPRKN